MIDEKQLKFIEKLIPKGECVNLSQGRLFAQKGLTRVSIPLDLGIECDPSGQEFINALRSLRSFTSDEPPILKLEDENLKIESDELNTTIKCGEFCDKIDLNMNSTFIKLNFEDLILKLNKIKSFVKNKLVDDYEWCNCAILDGQFIYATTNTMIVKIPYVCDKLCKPIMIPLEGIKALLRDKKTPPRYLIIASNIVAFAYEDYSLIECIQPDISSFNLETLQLLLEPNEYGHSDLDEDFFEKIERIKPHCHKLVYIENNKLKNSLMSENATAIKINSSGVIGAFRIQDILKFKKLVNKVNYSKYDDSLYLAGEEIEGVLERV